MLLQQGHHVTALVRNPAGAEDLVRLGARLHPGDITETESMREGMRGADGVFHVAAWYRIGARERTAAERINVGGTRNVLELMRELGVPKGVYTSTLAVFSDTRGQTVDESYRHHGPWLSEYDRTKWVAHYEVAEPMMRAGLPLIIVQPGLNYGPGDTSSLRETFIQYLKGRLPMLPTGTAFCWAHVEDTVRGHIQAMERGRVGEAYIIAGPAHTLVDAFEIAKGITGIAPPTVRPRAGMLKAMARVMGMVERILPVPELYAAETLRIMAGVTYLGTSAKAARELGFSARPLAEGLRETLEHEMRLIV